MEIEVGKTYKACIPFSGHEPIKIHIMYILDGHYRDQKLIVYRVYGKHKQWWHQFMCRDREMDIYIKDAKAY